MNEVTSEYEPCCICGEPISHINVQLFFKHMATHFQGHRKKWFRFLDKAKKVYAREGMNPSQLDKFKDLVPITTEDAINELNRIYRRVIRAGGGTGEDRP